MQIILLQCYIFMKLYLMFWCQQCFLLQRIENQLQVFVSDISMWCIEGDDNLPYSKNSFFLTFLPARYFWDQRIRCEWVNMMVEYIENMRTFDSIILNVYDCQSFDLQKFHLLSGGLRFWKKIKLIVINKPLRWIQ